MLVTRTIFIDLVKNAFIKYEKDIGNQCLLIMDKAASHISKEFIDFLNAK